MLKDKEGHFRNCEIIKEKEPENDGKYEGESWCKVADS